MLTQYPRDLTQHLIDEVSEGRLVEIWEDGIEDLGGGFCECVICGHAGDRRPLSTELVVIRKASYARTRVACEHCSAQRRA